MLGNCRVRGRVEENQLGLLSMFGPQVSKGVSGATRLWQILAPRGLGKQSLGPRQTPNRAHLKILPCTNIRAKIISWPTARSAHKWLAGAIINSPQAPPAPKVLHN